MIAGRRNAALTSSPVIPDGTTLLLKTYTNTRTYGINSLIKDSGSSTITVDWGDGTVNTYNGDVSGITHTYSSDGFFLLNVSDDVSSIGFKGSTVYNNIACTCSIGSKVTTFQTNCFQNGEISTDSTSSSWSGLTVDDFFNTVAKWTSGKEVVVNATSFGGYSAVFPCRRLRFTSFSSVNGNAFYSGGLRLVQHIVFDSPNISLPTDYSLNDWSGWASGWGSRWGYKTLRFTNKTLSQVQGMAKYPFFPSSVTTPITIYGSDGSESFNMPS